MKIKTINNLIANSDIMCEIIKFTHSDNKEECEKQLNSHLKFINSIRKYK